MPNGDTGHRVLRAGVFERSSVGRLLFAEKGYDYTPADVVASAHRLKAWKALRGRLTRAQLRDGKERIIERIRERTREIPVEKVENFLDVVVMLPPDAFPGDPRFESRVDWGSWLDQNAPGLDAELLRRLMEILGELVADFLRELEALGKFEIPAPTLTFTRQGELPPGTEVAEVGRALSVEVAPGVGATVTRMSRSVRGPVVVERLLVLIDTAGDVDVQVIAVPGGSSYPSTAGLAEVLGVAMFENTDDVGDTRNFVNMLGTGGMIEMWPRKVVGLDPVRFVFTVVNNSGAARTLLAVVDGRDVVRTA